MNAAHPRPLLTLMVVYLTLLGIMRLVGDSYCGWWLPLLRVELTWLLPKDALVDVGIAMRAGEQVYVAHIALDKMPAGALEIGTSAVATVSALSGNVVQSLLIVLTLVLSKARLTLEQRSLAVLGVLVVVTVLFCIDVPLVLIGAVDELLRAQEVAAQSSASDFARYGSVLDRGGRLALAALGAWALTESVARKR